MKRNLQFEESLRNLIDKTKKEINSINDNIFQLQNQKNILMDKIEGYQNQLDSLANKSFKEE